MFLLLNSKGHFNVLPLLLSIHLVPLNSRLKKKRKKAFAIGRVVERTRGTESEGPLLSSQLTFYFIIIRFFLDSSFSYPPFPPSRINHPHSSLI